MCPDGRHGGSRPRAFSQYVSSSVAGTSRIVCPTMRTVLVGEGGVWAEASGKKPAKQGQKEQKTVSES